MGYTGWNEPEPRCTICHQRPQLPHERHCVDNDCATAVLMHDARALKQTALTNANDEPVLALAWLSWQWRTTPDERETRVQAMAVQLLTQEMDEDEIAEFGELRAQRAPLVQAMRFKHTTPARLRVEQRAA